MKKPQIAIGIVVVLAAFAAADFHLNDLGRDLNLESKANPPQVVQQPEKPAPIQSEFSIGEMREGFMVKNQAVTDQVFDKVNLGGVKNIIVAKTLLEKGIEGGVAEPLMVYEVRGPAGQGALTYLAVKLQFVAQINATTETINEDARFGENSFFYNDTNLETTSFLLTQIKDTLYGFRFNKKSEATYQSIRKIIESLTSKP
jgi:hypothetical protein